MLELSRVSRGLAAVGLVVSCLGIGAAQEPAPTIFSASRNAVASGHVEKTTPQGFSIARNTFDEVNVKGGILVGFDVAFRQHSDVIAAIKPVYRTATGISYGREYGRFRVPDTRSRLRGGREIELRVTRLRAKPGFAVGKVELRTGLGMDAIALHYHQIVGRTLEPTASARSEMIGNLRGGSPGERSSESNPIVGVHGNLDDDGWNVIALGLIYVRPTAVVPAAPPPVVRRVPPVEKKAAPARVAPPPPPEPIDEPAREPGPAAKAEPDVPPPAPEVAAREENEPKPRVPAWVPVAVFLGVSGVIFLPVMLMLGRKKPTKARPATPRQPAVGEASSSAASTPASELFTANPVPQTTNLEPPPFFLVQSSNAWRGNFVYRAYATDEALLLIDVAPVSNGAAAQGGLVGAMAAWKEMKYAEARKAALEGATLADLEALACQGNSHCFRLAGLKARVDAQSWWDALATLSSAQGMLRLLHPNQGEFKFQFQALDEMQKALEVLQRTLGDRLDVNVVFDRVRWRYVRLR